MVKVNFYINGNLVNPPVNWVNLELELNFDKDRNRLQVQETITLNTLEWARENADFFINHINDGVGTGVGILEAPALVIEIERGTQVEKIFDGYIDTSSGGIFSKIVSGFEIKERKKIDWLKDVADGFGLKYLHQIGELTDDDFIFVPYILNSIPDYKEAAIALVTVAFIGQELRSAINELSKLSTALTNVFDFTAALQFILQILYVVALLITLVKLIKDIVLFIIQPVKYHACMTVKKQLELCSEHLGLTFKSDILDSPEWDGLCIIPEKYFNPPDVTEPRIFGFKTPDKTKQLGYYKGTFGQLLRDMKTVFNGKIELKKNNSTGNDELHLVRDDTNLSTPQYQLKDIRHFEFSHNGDEAKGSSITSFLTDPTEKNTIQEYKGTAYEQVLKPIRITDPDLVLMKGPPIRVDIPFALAKRKTQLTIPEVIVDFFLTVFDALVNAIASVINAVIDVLNFIIGVINDVINALSIIGIDISFQITPVPNIPYANLSGLIDNRIGMLKIETDYFEIPKLVLLDIKSEPKNTKIKTTNKDYLSAEYLWKNYHFLKSWLPTVARPTGNQYLIKRYQNVSFTFLDYLQVKDSNIIFDYDNNLAEVRSLKWNPRSLVADFDIWFPKLLTDNLQVIELIPDGK